ncbi:hypothetical protein INT44_008369 [Umbelopsis vinacea]|uniref:Uncharacterized protein n=1 Tax=Umbelopsis vinacea TaxID=44442 RepID=A0A8H7UJT0_9FUNG|nr:hypothetical protein INT44_008369 [Umbelopsis vinacea]
MASTVPKFLEEFALDTSIEARSDILKKLVPGSEDAYYYESLVLLQKLEAILQQKKIDLEKLPVELSQEELAIFEQVKGKITESSSRNRDDVESKLKMRFYLLSYPIEPAASCKYLMQQHGIDPLTFSRNQETVSGDASLEESNNNAARHPSALDSNFFSESRLTELFQNEYLDSLRNSSNPFEPIAIPFLYNLPLQSDYDDYLVIRYILGSAGNAPINLPGFVKRLAKAVATRFSQKKKDVQMYDRLDLKGLTLMQLSELAEELPAILSDMNFVVLYLTKLQPATDQFPNDTIDQFTPDDVVKDYLDKALEFLSKVPSGAEKWKRMALHKQLVMNLYHENYDSDKFLETEESVDYFLGARDNDKVCGFSCKHQMGRPKFSSAPQLFLLDAPEVSETTLITEYLKLLLNLGVPVETFHDILDSQSFLNPLYAETKFTSGKITANEWENPKLQTVDPNIDLDGLTPIWESYKNNVTSNPKDIHEPSFTFGGENGLAGKEISGRGLWVIDFISGRKSCRALIQKGFVNCIIRPTVSGQLLTITDERNQRITSGYTVWLKGKEYESDSSSNITLPFTETQESNPLLIKLENYAQVVDYQSITEDYKFDASFYVNHESLQKENTASVTVIPFLNVGDQRAPLSLLEDMVLSVTSNDKAGIESTYKLADVHFTDNKPYTGQFRVPPDLECLRFNLEGKIKRCSGGERYQQVAATHLINIDRSDHECISAYARSDESGYTLYVTGKNGEPKSRYTISVELKHKFIRSTIPISFTTNENGEVKLGQLSNITRIRIPKLRQDIQVKVDEQVNFWPTSIFESEGNNIRLPFFSGEDNILSLGKSGVDSSLLADFSDKMTVHPGFIQIQELTPGKYHLRCVMTNTAVEVLLYIIGGGTETPKDKLWTNLTLGQRWIAESPGEMTRTPLSIHDIFVDDRTINVKLQNFSSKTYAIVSGTSTLSHRTPQENYLPKRTQKRHLLRSIGESQNNTLFVSGRKLSEEYQYILERSRFNKWTSTILQNPSLLLKRQKQSDTTVTNKKLKTAVGFGSVPRGRSFRGMDRVLMRGEKLMALNSSAFPDAVPEYGMYTNFSIKLITNTLLTIQLDFLKITNLETQVVTPDVNGQIVLDRQSIGTSNYLSILVISGDQVVARDIKLQCQTQLSTIDLRHFAPVDPGKAIVRAREVTLLATADAPKDVCVDQDREVIDSIEKLYSIYKTLNSSQDLEEFSFLNTWESLSKEEKLKLFDEHVCHELNFWLMHKDKDFFDQVVKIALQSKLKKTFLDLYMLNSDLEPFANDLHQFETLNIFEKVLLAKRVPAIHDTVRKLMLEGIEISPPETSVLQDQFDTVLAGTSMSLERGQDMAMAISAPMSAPPPAPSIAAQMYSSVESVPQPAPTTRSFGSSSFRSSALPPPPPRSAQLDNIQEQEVVNDSLDGDDLDDNDEEEKALMEMRQNVQKSHTYQYKDRTREYRETNYLLQYVSISVNAFWLDYLTHEGNSPFLSQYFAQATGSFTEQVFALAILDVPYKNRAEISSNFIPEENKVKISASTPALVFHRNLKLYEVASNQERLLVVQNIFNPSEYDQLGKIQVIPNHDMRKSVEYGMHIVISNMTAETYVIEVSFQIPIGSVPTRRSRYLDATTIRIDPYTTWQKATSFFYFPEDGEYTNVPISVTVNGELVATSKLTDIVVKQSVVEGGVKDWQSIASHGTTTEVIEYLKTTNLMKTDINLITARMSNPAFASSVLSVLRDRKYYNFSLWAYGVRHNLPLAIRDFLKMEQHQLEKVGKFFTSALVDLPKTSFTYFQILDYDPIVKARAHSVGSDKVILNHAFYQQYVSFLEYLSQKRDHDVEDLLCLGIYLVYQERLTEARKVHTKIKNALEDGHTLSIPVQSDYLDAFLSLRIPCDDLDSYDQTIESTRDLAIKYKDYPLLTWRRRFEDIVNIYNEVDGSSTSFDEEDKQLTVEQLNIKELSRGPSLELKVTDTHAVVSCANIRNMRLKIYALNIEMLFSTNPFISKNSSGNYSLVAANYDHEYNVEQCLQEPSNDSLHFRAATDEFELIGKSNPGVSLIKLDIPAELQNKNVLVEVQGGGIIQSSAHFSNALNVQVVENSGLIRVLSKKNGRPNVGSYVKIYVKLHSGNVHFWKDGYTAINGIFDYVSVTEDNALVGTDGSSLKSIMKQVQKISILVLSSDAGGLIRVVEPPK